MDIKVSRIVIYDREGIELASFLLEEKEKAFEYAAQLEEMDIDFTLREPSLPESLISSLGANDLDQARLQKEILEEIESHGSPTCDPCKT